MHCGLTKIGEYGVLAEYLRIPWWPCAAQYVWRTIDVNKL